jgi:hypothetical protein
LIAARDFAQLALRAIFFYPAGGLAGRLQHDPARICKAATTMNNED